MADFYFSCSKRPSVISESLSELITTQFMHLIFRPCFENLISMSGGTVPVQ